MLDAKTIRPLTPKKNVWLIDFLFAAPFFAFLLLLQHHRMYLMFVFIVWGIVRRSIIVSRWSSNTAKKNPAGVMGLIGVWKAKTMSEIETKDRLFRPTKSISWNGEKMWCGKAPGKFPLRDEREDFRCIRSGTEIFNLNKSATWGWRMSRANVFNHQRDLCECNARLLCLVSSYTFVMVEISGGWWAARRRRDENVERNHKS